MVWPSSQARCTHGSHHQPSDIAYQFGGAVKHAGQTTLYLTPMHAAKEKLLALIVNIRKALSHVRAVAEQLPQTDRWNTLLDYVVAKINRPLTPWITSDRFTMAG